MRFSASLDQLTKVVSTGLFVVPAAAGLALHIHVLLAVLFVPIALLAYAWSPRRYTVAGGAVTVHRLIGNATIPLAGLREARRADPDELKGAIRMFGSGGLFGYYGKFWNSTLGKMTWYVTNRRNIVVLIGEETTLFSPDDVDGFLTAVGVPAGGGTAATAGKPQTWKVVLAGIAVVAGVVAFIANLLTFSPGAPPYSLADGALKIQDHFYPVTLHASDIDAQDAGVVDLASNPEWRPVARTNGFADLHYRSGWFRVANGQKVRLYQADSKRLVLLPGRDGKPAVLIQVSDPDGFIAQIKQQLR